MLIYIRGERFEKGMIKGNVEPKGEMQLDPQLEKGARHPVDSGLVEFTLIVGNLSEPKD